MLISLSCKNSNFLRHCRPQSKQFLRDITSLEKKRSKSFILSKTHYKIIYNFPYIKIIIPILKTRQWVPAVAVATSPFLYYLDDTKVSPAIVLISAGCYFLLGMALSKISKNIVGKMYVNKEGNIKDIMISSIDDFGRRIDKIHNLQDVINSDFPSTSARYLGFVRLIVENSDVYYLLNISNCEFTDEKVCNCILQGNWSFYDINGKDNETEVKDSTRKLEK